MDSSRNIDISNLNTNHNSNHNSNIIVILIILIIDKIEHIIICLILIPLIRNNRLRNFNQIANNNLRNPRTRYIGMRFRF